jgi:hypothetical protein
MSLLEVYAANGFHVLRTRYLSGQDLVQQRQYYQSIGYTVKEIQL